MVTGGRSSDSLAGAGTDLRTSNGQATFQEQDVAAAVRGAAMGNQEEWNRLVDWFAPTVWAVARRHRLNAADAADASQTTWLRLVENLGRIEQPERVGAWLATTAKRESLRLLKLGVSQVSSSDGLDHIAATDLHMRHDHNLIAPANQTPMKL